MTQSPTPAKTRGADTRRRLLDAAVDVLAEEGMGAFTHRIVEKRAGVYHGATTHFFGSRDELVDAVFGHLFALDQDVARQGPGGVGGAAWPTDPALLRAVLRGGVRALIAGRREALARYALVVHAAQEPRLQASLARWRAAIVDVAAPLMAALGSEHPEAAARFFVAGADGLLLHLLSAPWGATDADVDAMAEALITGALAVRKEP